MRSTIAMTPPDRNRLAGRSVCTGGAIQWYAVAENTASALAVATSNFSKSPTLTRRRSDGRFERNLAAIAEPISIA
jgi:hypothetical protein